MCFIYDPDTKDHLTISYFKNNLICMVKEKNYAVIFFQK